MNATQLHLVDAYTESALLSPTSEWIDTKAVANILCVSVQSFHNSFREKNNYWEVRRFLRGTNGNLSARGQGNLFNVHDIRRILYVRQTLRCYLSVAARVFAAQRLGKI